MTRPFSFKLEKILAYRRQAEDQAKLALAQARRDLEQELDRGERLTKALVDCAAQRAGAKRMTQADIWLWNGYEQRLLLDKRESDAKVENLRTQAETKRRELVAKAMERKLLEKLRARQAARYEQDAQRKEQNEFDETATLRHGRAPA